MAVSQQLICLVITMGKTSPTFKQRDLMRAYRAVGAAGGHVARIEIDKGGKIILVPAQTGQVIKAAGTHDYKQITEAMIAGGRNRRGKTSWPQLSMVSIISFLAFDLTIRQIVDDFRVRGAGDADH
jgi:hypothetical protein